MSEPEKKILYVSPMPPMKTGIADYSEILIREIAKSHDVTVLIDGLYDASNHAQYESYPHRETKVKTIREIPDLSQFNEVIYNLGNNPFYHQTAYRLSQQHPGIVILHDVELYFLTVGIYRDTEEFFLKMNELGGRAIIRRFKELLIEGKDYYAEKRTGLFPLNQEVLASAKEILVHSHFAKSMIEASGHPHAPVRVIHLLSDNPKPTEKPRHKVLKKWNLPTDAKLFTSFGYIAPIKLNREVCAMIDAAVARGASTLHYLMVGQGDDVDDRLNANIHKTGYCDQESFFELMAHSDCIMNLRNPSIGETSATLTQAMGYGKACVVNDVGWFRELPDNAVIKIGTTDIAGDLTRFMDSYLAGTLDLNKYGAGARRYVEQFCEPKTVVQSILGDL